MQGDWKKTVWPTQQVTLWIKAGGWRNKWLHEVLKKLGFTRTYSDASLYSMFTTISDHHASLCRWHDCWHPSQKWPSTHFVIELGNTQMQDLGPTTQLLGIEIDGDHSQWSISAIQHWYTVEILQNSGWRIVTSLTPMELDYDYSNDMFRHGFATTPVDLLEFWWVQTIAETILADWHWCYSNCSM